jgi:hypothetical protein
MNLDITASMVRYAYCTEDMFLDNENRYSTSYICTVPATAKAEGIEAVIREGITHANKLRAAVGLRPLRVVARGRGANRLVRAVDAGYVTCASRVAQNLPRSAAERIDLYLYLVSY